MFVLMHLGEDWASWFVLLLVYSPYTLHVPFLVFAHDIARHGLTTFHTLRKNQVKVADCKGKSTLQSTTSPSYARTAEGAQRQVHIRQLVWNHEASRYQTLGVDRRGLKGPLFSEPATKPTCLNCPSCPAGTYLAEQYSRVTLRTPGHICQKLQGHVRTTET